VPTALERLHAAGFAKYAVAAADKRIMNKYVAYYKGEYVYIDLINAGKKKNFSDYEEL
jgi:6-phosphofructokinase 1